MKVMCVFGTRPEAIKMCPLVKELKSRPQLQTLVCVSGQHRQMLDQVLSAFSIVPDYDLSIMKERQTLFDVTSGILNRIRSVLEKERPDVVLVHGDTTTTFSTALACFYLHIRVGHVEAGLRTYNIQSPWPEEFNRQAVSILANYNFMARAHLILTDSGGIQEEAPSLGKPVLVMRDTTERPEGISAGTLKLVGTEEENIYREFKKLLTDKKEYDRMSKASNPYGDGLASKRIADVLCSAKTGK